MVDYNGAGARRSAPSCVDYNGATIMVDTLDYDTASDVDYEAASYRRPRFSALLAESGSAYRWNIGNPCTGALANGQKNVKL